MSTAMSVGAHAEGLTRGSPEASVLQPDETVLEAMRRMFKFHRNPQPSIDYSRLTSLAPDAEPTETAEMPGPQASIHAEAAERIYGHLSQLGVEIELPFAEAA
jgi:hypothetical protein